MAILPIDEIEKKPRDVVKMLLPIFVESD